MAKRLSRIERDIERLKEKISEYQQQLKELEAAKTEQENLQIIQLVRSMNMKPDEFAAFLRSGALNAAPTVTPYHKQEDRGCQFVMWKNDRFFEQRKKAFTPKIAAALLKNGKAKVKGLYSEKTGKTYDATVLLADTGGKYVNYRVERKE